MNTPTSIIFLGATGAVGGEALKRALTLPAVDLITLLGRRDVEGLTHAAVRQIKVDVKDAVSFEKSVGPHDVAICTLGIGQPSKVTDEQFVAIDKTAVLNFARACKSAGVKHFQLLASVGVSATSSTFYLRIKGELVEELKALNFDRLSIFKPSMILTPTNRYGWKQGLTLKVWPILNPLFFGGMKQYRGVKVETLGSAFIGNMNTEGSGYEELTWVNFQELGRFVI
ncbi:MAG: NAD(P)H-binding protein [Saprospiraceae bacterium]